jgi:hypothetical protein
LYDFRVKRPHVLKALTFVFSTGAIVLTSCSTTETRISGHPEIYQSLSPGDQALVSQGKIRPGMSQGAVWLAWGSPDRTAAGNMRGRATETWVYVSYTTPPYDYGGYGYPYGPYPYYGFGWGGGAFVRTHHGGRTFVFFGSPFYDPFYYSYIPPSVPYPSKTVTFSNGRVMSFQYLVPR